MPGRGKIDEYNKTLTKEERVKSAKKAAKASAKVRGEKKGLNKTIRQFARMINDAKATDDAIEELKKLGLDENATNGAVIAASVFMAAFNGDMKAVDKWERYIGEDDRGTDGEGELSALILGLKR